MDSSSDSALLIVINGEVRLEYLRGQRLPGKQRLFLEKMDQDMDAGIVLEGVALDSPDQRQRTQYVAIELLHAMHADNQGLVSATCAWLVSRSPQLKQVIARDDDEQVEMRLLFDSPTSD